MAKKLVEYDSDCVGCEECISCGRDKEYPVFEYECDGCGDTDCKDRFGNIELFKFNGMDLCPGCLMYEWLNTKPTEQIQAKLLEYKVEDLLKDEFERVKEE